MTRLIKRAGLGYLVNKKRVIRIMKEHGIKADYRLRISPLHMEFHYPLLYSSHPVSDALLRLTL